MNMTSATIEDQKEDGFAAMRARSACIETGIDNPKKAAECKRLLSLAQRRMFDCLFDTIHARPFGVTEPQNFGSGVPAGCVAAADIREHFHCTKASAQAVSDAYSAYWK